MPSMPMLVTPERSDTTPPSPPKMNGVAYVRVMAMSMIRLLSIVVLLP